MNPQHREVQEVALANDISKYLCQIYPNHSWAVNVDTHGGVVKILEADIQDPTLPFVIRLCEVTYSWKKFQELLVIAGGEILERFGLSRERRSASAIVDSKNSLLVDHAGKPIINTDDTKNWTGEKSK